MATGVVGTQQRAMVLGQYITRAAALLPQTATAPIFNVVGGKVLVTSFIGTVIVVTPATANTLKVTGNATAGTDTDFCTAVSVASKEALSLVTLPNPVAAGSNLVIGTAGAGITMPDPFVVQTGTIDLTTSGSAATGTWTWTLTYVPIDTGAYISVA